MAANLRRHGYKGNILMDPAGTTTYVAVASMRSWELNMTRERVDITCFLDPTRIWAQGLPNIEGSFEGMWEAVASTALIDVMLGDVAVGLKLVPSELDATNYFSGLAYLDGTITVPVDGAITLAGTFVGAGPWTHASTP